MKSKIICDDYSTINAGINLLLGSFRRILFFSTYPSLCDMSHNDGWGEGLEQREIKVEDGELYLSFWDSSDRFFIKPEDELKGSQSFGFGMTMGGMR